MSIEKIKETIDPEKLGISKEELYAKYKEWRMWKGKSGIINDAVVVSTIFGIPIENKTAIYFLLFGIEVFQYGIDKIEEEKKNDVDRH